MTAPALDEACSPPPPSFFRRGGTLAAYVALRMMGVAPEIAAIEVAARLLERRAWRRVWPRRVLIGQVLLRAELAARAEGLCE